MTTKQYKDAHRIFSSAVALDACDEEYEEAKRALWIACDKKHNLFHRSIHSAIDIGNRTKVNIIKLKQKEIYKL